MLDFVIQTTEKRLELLLLYLGSLKKANAKFMNEIVRDFARIHLLPPHDNCALVFLTYKHVIGERQVSGECYLYSSKSVNSCENFLFRLLRLDDFTNKLCFYTGIYFLIKLKTTQRTLNTMKVNCAQIIF